RLRVDPQLERRALVVVPDLDGVDAVPAALLARAQEEVDRRARAAPRRRGVAPRLAVVAAFGMRREPEARDELVGGAHEALSATMTASRPAPSHSARKPSS